VYKHLQRCLYIKSGRQKEGIDLVRVLIPLGEASEAEAVFDLLKDDLNSNPEIILLQIVYLEHIINLWKNVTPSPRNPW
jgi:hypothetical protein